MKRSEYLRNSYNEAKDQIYKDFATKFMELKIDFDTESDFDNE